MNTKDAIIEIIEINKVIKDNGMNLLSTLSEVKEAPYSSLVKPLRKKFEDDWDNADFQDLLKKLCYVKNN